MSQINKIGVIGAGNMGSGIAQKIAQEGLNVVVVDIKDEYVKRGLGIIKQLLGEGVERKIFTPGQVEEIFSRITGTTDFSAVADADLVIEAVFEDKQVKSDLFKKLDQLCAEKTILATNTSSFFVREFADADVPSRPFHRSPLFLPPCKKQAFRGHSPRGNQPGNFREITSGGKTARQNIHRRQRCPGLCRKPLLRSLSQRGGPDAGRKCCQYSHHRRSGQTGV